MNHHTTADFWDCYNRLPEAVRKLADANYELLKADSRHPSLHFTRVGKRWSVRVGIGFRALPADGDDGPIWFWIGSHADYDRLIGGTSAGKTGNPNKLPNNSLQQTRRPQRSCAAYRHAGPACC